MTLSLKKFQRQGPLGSERNEAEESPRTRVVRIVPGGCESQDDLTFLRVPAGYTTTLFNITRQGTPSTDTHEKGHLRVPTCSESFEVAGSVREVTSKVVSERGNVKPDTCRVS